MKVGRLGYVVQRSLPELSFATIWSILCGERHESQRSILDVYTECNEPNFHIVLTIAEITKQPVTKICGLCTCNTFLRTFPNWYWTIGITLATDHSSWDWGESFSLVYMEKIRDVGTQLVIIGFSLEMLLNQVIYLVP